MTDTGHDLTRLRIERAQTHGSGSRLWPWIVLLVVVLLAVAAWWQFGREHDARPAVAVARVESSGGAASVSGTAANDKPPHY